jgi:hypothetical protein
VPEAYRVCPWRSLGAACALAALAALPGASAQEKPSTANVHDAAARSPVSRATKGEATTAKNLGVRGITGSLTSFDVEQAMRTRSSALLDCVKRTRPRAIGYVSGEITFHIALDGKGTVEKVEVVSSDLAHTPLEACLREVVATAPFPVPAGSQPAETQWRMTVDPLQRPPEPMDAALLEALLARESEAIYERCELAKASRFLVQGYVQRTRKLHPLNVRALRRESSTEQLDCLRDALARWRGFPKARAIAKVSLELRWQAAPAAPRARHRPRRK